MTNITMKKIKAKIQNDKSISKERQSELLKLLSILESEITEFSKTEAEQAESITGFVERSTHEATKKSKSPQLLELSLATLSESVKGFEASHPGMVANVNGICTVLGNMGI